MGAAVTPANVAHLCWDLPDREVKAKVGDLVICRLMTTSLGHDRVEFVGQVVRQTDIMSEVITTSGSHMVRTNSLEVVQPGHPRDTHSTGGGQRA
jgi:hypothetical protein